MFTVFIIIQVLLALSIIGLVLLQQGKGADMGAAFGAGASGSVFGARGGGSFLSRATAILAALFFANSILLSSPLIRNEQSANGSVTQSVTSQPVEEVEVPVVEEESTEEIVVDQAPADVPDVPGDTTEAEGTSSASDLPDVPEAGEPEPARDESDLPE